MYFSLLLKRWCVVAIASTCLITMGCEQLQPNRADAGSPNAGDQNEETATDPVVEPEVDPAELIAQADVYYAMCGGELKSMADILVPIAANMQAQNMPYKISQEPVDEWRDCSGNFLRLSSYVASACAENKDNLAAPPGITDYVPGGNNAAPDPKGPRSSKGVGQWYNDQGRFTPIYYDGVTDISLPPQDLIDNRHLIKPGAVVWFSRERPMSTDGLDILWTAGSRKAINHMGTVTEVMRDEDGNVIRYKIYHGHGKEGVTTAGVTDYHFWEWPATYTSGGQKYPPFGFWGQYIVGIGTLLPTEAPPPTPDV